MGSGIKKSKTLGDVFDAMFYLMMMKGVINSREYEELLLHIPNEQSPPDKLVQALLNVSGGSREFEVEEEKALCDDYI